MKYSNELKKGWGKGDLLCGPGSLEKHAKPSREKLRHWLSVTEAKSILEIGCGDLVWHGPELPNIDYHGIDLHERDTWVERREQGAKLSVMPANSPKLPKADFIIARAVFIHLSNDYILEVLTEIKKFGKWVFASHDPNADFSRYGRTGPVFNRHGFGVNLHKPPFSLSYHEKQSPGEFEGMYLFSL